MEAFVIIIVLKQHRTNPKNNNFHVFKMIKIMSDNT